MTYVTLDILARHVLDFDQGSQQTGDREMSGAIKVTGIDNRGDATVPFGYVYFSDGNRLGFGNTRDGKGTYGLFAGNWGDVPQSHYDAADKALIAELSA